MEVVEPVATDPPPPDVTVAAVTAPAVVEQQQQVAAPVVESEPVVAEDTTMHDLALRFKSLVTITGFTDDMWTEDKMNTIMEFLSDTKRQKLLAFVDNEAKPPAFCLQTSIPAGKIREMVYFIKDTTKEGLTHENFERKIHYGTLHGHALDSLLRVMQGVYVPLLAENRNWPESVRKDFRSQMHKFMAFLTDATYQVKGHTVLYVPAEDFPDYEVAAKSKDVVQRLESLLIHWTRQIKEVVNNQHTSETTENSGPLEEIQFWRCRCEDLSGISDQLNRMDLKKILMVLDLAKSSYLEQFLRLSNNIQEGTQQAQDNLKFLSTLAEPCQVLANAEPKDIPAILPKLLNCIRMIWANSKFYNTKERLTSLLRKVSSEIIRRCCAKISLEEIFFGDVQSSMNGLQDSINCGESWKSIYKKTVAHVAKYSSGTWDFDQSSIFAQIDAFVQRCRDLLEVCEGQIQFARKISGGEKAPIPIFGGSKGPEIAKSLEDIEVAFERNILSLWNIRKYILDVKATRWHDDFNAFKQGVKDLEVMMQNVIISAFEGAMTVETGVELLEIFHHLAKREAIKRSVEKKTADVYLMFLQELNIVKVDFETHKKTPEMLRCHPDFAGSAFWARSLLKRIQFSMNILQAAYYLPHTSLADEVKQQYEPLVTSIEDYIGKTHQEWSVNVPATSGEKLEETLMSRRTGSDFLDIKFDHDLLRVFSEIHYWQKQKMDVPFHIQEIYSKKEELRILRENVLLVVRDYNGILETLTPEEHYLFKERIRFLDRKINPGLTNLTWASKGITDYFVKECRRYSHDVQKTVTDFIESNSNIKRQCKIISDLLLWNVESKKIYDLEEFEAVQEAYRETIKGKLRHAHATIEQILKSLFEIFRNDGPAVYQHWVKFVEKTDYLVEESLRTSVKRSLQEIAKSINGESKNRDSATEIQPLFKVNVVLDSQRVDFSPTLQRLEETVNKVAREMISCTEVVPRLTELLIPDSKKVILKIFDVISSEDDVLKNFVSIQNGMGNNSVKCQNYLRTWDSYREIWEINKDAFIRRYAKLKPALSTFDAEIHPLVSHCNAWQNKLTTLLNSNASTELNNLHEMFTKKSEKLKANPVDLDQLSDSLLLLQQLQTDAPSIEGQFGPIHEQYQILEKYEVPIKEDERMQLETLQPAWVAFQQTMVEADKMLQESKAKFRADLISSVDDFSKGMASIREEFSSKGPFTASYGIDKALKTIVEYRQVLTAATEQETNLKKGLAVFKLEQAPNKEIGQISNELDLLQQIWQLSQEWSTVWEGWRLKPFLGLDATEMEDSIQKFLKRIQKMGKEMKDWDVYNNLKEKISQCRRTIPILQDLKNPAMRERHWSQIMDEVGKTFDPKSDDFTLEKILELGLDQSTEPIFELLEDNQVTLSAMKASKFFVAFEAQVDKWERTLSQVMEVVEMLLQVQRQWMYLENIFVGTEDIRKQLPKESSIFDGVNTNYKSIMAKMVADKNVRRATHQEGLLEMLTEMNGKLEKIQKSLDMYLETKRQAFPRFYFLSNDDLLEILGQAKDPNAVQPHLKKCFDNLHKLELTTAGTDLRRHFEATGMHSGDGEFVPFFTPVILEGPVESWLTDVECTMRSTLKKLLYGSLVALKKSKKDKWIKDWPGQLLITSGLIAWTQDWAKSLLEVEKGEQGALKTLKKKQISGLKKLADLVRSPLSKVERKKLIALITVEVHSRDVIERMAKAECNGINAFEWLSQLRFYWEKDGNDEDCFIRQINTQFRYGYEYLGNSGRLVITPLTDRCYMTLTTALHLQRGGSPQGPAGTGKTETVKDLGKALGKYVIVQNCSEALDYKSIGRMFSGLAQTGAWGCFDEFNRIDIEVLSVVALQVSSILTAIARNAKTFIFEGKEIRLNVTCGIFITMNPGYAGRTELPDNLKSLFRPVSMMVPDSALIAEIMLFAEGFSNTRNLSKKVDTLYRLSAQQLSKQDHYDFGLRALTSLLRSAGGRKRADPNSSDEVVLLGSMRENNIPKLTAEDVPLFTGILSDLFPGVEAVTVDYSEFRSVLVEEMKLLNLQPIEPMIIKCIQLYETKLSRHGVMIVGNTGSGKSVVCKSLQNTLTKLSKVKPDNYVSVKSYPINPKALSLGELYGEVNIATNEWTDGILSSVMRTACSDDKKDQKWIYLDGPVDTLWIESRNTVLDDNKVLTLINGERIALPEQVSLLFEVEDLSTASPATVSRAGMIYMDYKDLGWRP
ncbi:Dynein heavy chain 2, axonemal, partial [Blyttiomyces sp. JEL0837]